jgi:uncharacterized RDD family membrane protein YckC
MRLAGWQEHEWSDRTVLKSADGQAQVFDAILAAEVYGDTAVVARLGKDGTPELAAWSIVTGEPIRPFELVSPLAPVGAPHLRPATRTFVSYLVLMALLAAVVIWRRERIVVPAPLTPDQVFAALSARVTAVLIDLLITAPVWGPIAFWAWSGADGLAALANWTDPSAVPSTATIWTPALIGAIYAVYAAAFELAIRTTPGKRIMRCTVVAEGGEPCSAKAVLIRNAARIVEFHFAAVALLVVLTPSRQRLGDILAKTVVTQPTPPEPEAGEHFSDGSGFPDDQAR